MEDKTNKKMEISYVELQDAIIQKLKEIYDPEIPVNIYDLGLIYEVNVDLSKKVKIVMTLTTPACPVAQSLPDEVKQKLEEVAGVGNVEVELTWEPAWDMSKLTDEAKLALGIL